MSAERAEDFIRVYDNALDPDFCRRLIDRFEASGQAVAGRTGGGVDPEKKRSRDITISTLDNWQEDLREILAAANPRLADYIRAFHFLLLGAMSPAVPDPDSGQPVTLDHDNFERLGGPHFDALMGRFYRYGHLNLQHYARTTGGYPHWHSEIYPQDAGCESLHRVLFFMFYLNDVEEGGETEFFYQDRAVRPRRGRMLVAPAGFTHTHRGQPPLSGDKYILTSWVMFHRAEAIYGAG